MLGTSSERSAPSGFVRPPEPAPQGCHSDLHSEPSFPVQWSSAVTALPVCKPPEPLCLVPTCGSRVRSAKPVCPGVPRNGACRQARGNWPSDGRRKEPHQEVYAGAGHSCFGHQVALVLLFTLLFLPKETLSCLLSALVRAPLQSCVQLCWSFILGIPDTIESWNHSVIL